MQEQQNMEVSYFRLHGLDGWLAAVVTVAEEKGRQWAVVCLAAAEAFPQGALEGVVAHWGIAGTGKTGGWERPPEGWLSDPDQHRSTGWSSCLRIILPVTNLLLQIKLFAWDGHEGLPGHVQFPTSSTQSIVHILARMPSIKF